MPVQATDHFSCSVLTIKAPSYYKCDNQLYLSVIQLLSVIYSMTDFSIREKKNLVKDLFILKRVQGCCFPWNTMDDESVTVANEETLK